MEMIWLLVSLTGDGSLPNTTLNGAASNEGREALQNDWSPLTHHYFPKCVRDSVVRYKLIFSCCCCSYESSFLLVAKRMQWSLDDAVKHKIIRLIVSRWQV